MPLDRSAHRRRLECVEEHDSSAVVISSAVPGFFAAGADLKHIATLDPRGFEHYRDSLRSPLERLASCGRPSIAAIDGLALGGGLELAMACTLRFASARVAARPAGGQARGVPRCGGPAAAAMAGAPGALRPDGRSGLPSSAVGPRSRSGRRKRSNCSRTWSARTLDQQRASLALLADGRRRWRAIMTCGRRGGWRGQSWVWRSRDTRSRACSPKGTRKPGSPRSSTSSAVARGNECMRWCGRPAALHDHSAGDIETAIAGTAASSRGRRLRRRLDARVLHALCGRDARCDRGPHRTLPGRHRDRVRDRPPARA